MRHPQSPFRDLQAVALSIRVCLCFGCVYQVYRQNEARAISAFALPIDIAPHNPIGLAIGVSPAAAESSNRLRAAGQGHPDNSFFIEEAYNQEPSVVQHIEFARISTVRFRLAEGIVAQLKEQATQIQKVSAQVEVSKPAPHVVANKP